jgi:hypothetical protein
LPPYSKYASSTTTIACGNDRARAAISSGSTSPPVGLFGLQTQTRSASAGSSASAAPSIGLLDEGAATRPEEGSRGQRDQPVDSGTGDDLVRLDAGIACSGFAEVAVRAVGILVEPREALAERNLRHAGQRRDVLVEADDLGRVQPVPGGDLLERQSPGIRLEPVRQRPGAHALTARDSA